LKRKNIELVSCTITPRKKVIVQQKYRNYRLVMYKKKLAWRVYVIPQINNEAEFY